MKYGIEDVEIDNRDSETTELVLPLDVRVPYQTALVVTKADLEELLQNMKDNMPPSDRDPVEVLLEACNDEDGYMEVRSALLQEEPWNESMQHYAEMIDSLPTEAATRVCLALSVCPLHCVDYAICFDDENPECNQIRLIHPGHDT